LKRVIRRRTYLDDLRAISAYIAKDSPQAAARLRLHIDDQVAKLADPKFPRRRGRRAGTKELVAHENYIVILIEDAETVTALNVVHARRQFP
jgi:plasmid stabilization system protein ParE